MKHLKAILISDPVVSLKFLKNLNELQEIAIESFTFQSQRELVYLSCKEELKTADFTQTNLKCFDETRFERIILFITKESEENPFNEDDMELMKDKALMREELQNIYNLK